MNPNLYLMGFNTYFTCLVVEIGYPTYTVWNVKFAKLKAM